MKKFFSLLITLTVLFGVVICLEGCKKTVKVVATGTNTCADFQINGDLAKSGTIYITGIINYVKLNNAKCTYSRAGNNVTITVPLIVRSSLGLKEITGIYNAVSNKLTLTGEAAVSCYLKN